MAKLWFSILIKSFILINKSRNHKKVITLRQLTGNLDDELESIIKQLSLDKELDHSSKNTHEMLKARIEKNMSKLNDISDKIESNDLDGLRALRTNVVSMQNELPALKSKSKKFDEIEVKQLENKINDTLQAIDDWKERIQGLSNAQNNFESDKVYVQKLLDSIKKIINDDLDERYKLSKLKSAQTQLENAQERANKLKKAKYDLKSMRKDLDYDSESSEASSDSIDQLTDDYMDLQDQVEEMIDEYSNLVNLRDSTVELNDTIDVWSRRTIHELNSSLDGSLEQRLSTLSDTLTQNWSRLSSLKVRAEPSDLNVTMNDMNSVRADLDEIDKTLKKVETARESAIQRVDKFHAEKDKLMKYVDELTVWLATKDKSLKSIQNTKNMKKCKELNVELVSQRENIETTKDHLNSLIRMFHSSDQIDDLVQAVRQLSNDYETVCQYSATLMSKFESNLEHDYDSIKERFFVWKKHAQDVLTECQDIIGEPLTINQNIENLKQILAKTDTVKGWLDEMEVKFKDQLMSKVDNITKHRNEFNGIVREVNHALKQMNDYSDFITTLDAERVDLQAWLDDMAKKVQTEKSIESAAKAQKLLDQFLALKKQFEAKASAFSNIQQQAYEVGDGDLGTIPGRRIQVMVQQHSSLEKKIADQVRLYESLISQNQIYQHSRSELRKWMTAIRQRNENVLLDVQAAGTTQAAQSAFNEAETLWVEKQEGEVKVHATLGRGDSISNAISSDGRIELEDEMGTLRSAFDELLDEMKSVRSQAELKLSELQGIDKAQNEIAAMLHDVTAVLNEEATLPNDFKEKKQAVDKMNDLLADVNELDEKLMEVNSRCVETGYDTLSSSNNEATLKYSLSPKFEPLGNQLDETREKIQARLNEVIEVKNDHEKWIISGNELEEWIQSAKEELARWSDVTLVDVDQLKKKTSKIDELKAAKETGRARLETTLALAAIAQKTTNTNGRELIRAEMQQQKNQWTEWESLLDETADSINMTITDLEQYREGYNSERTTLQVALESFNEKLEKIPKFENLTVDQINQANAALKKLDKEATEIRSKLNQLCRSYANEKSDDISADVTQALNNYSNLMQGLVTTRSRVEEAVGAKFKSKSSQFETYIRKHQNQIQKYTCPRGGLETAKSSLSDINRIINTSLDQGNKMLQELNEMADSSGESKKIEIFLNNFQALLINHQSTDTQHVSSRKSGKLLWPRQTKPNLAWRVISRVSTNSIRTVMS